MFWERFSSLCGKANVKPTPLVKQLGIAHGNVTRWKNGIIPETGALTKISNHFDCSVDYLLGRTDNPESHKQSGGEFLTQAERTLLENFRALNDEGQEKISDIAADYAALDRYKKRGQSEMADEA